MRKGLRIRTLEAHLASYLEKKQIMELRRLFPDQLEPCLRIELGSLRCMEQCMKRPELDFAGSPTASKIIEFLKGRGKRYFLTPSFDEDGDGDAADAGD